MFKAIKINKTTLIPNILHLSEKKTTPLYIRDKHLASDTKVQFRQISTVQQQSHKVVQYTSEKITRRDKIFYQCDSHIK